MNIYNLLNNIKIYFVNNINHYYLDRNLYKKITAINLKSTNKASSTPIHGHIPKVKSNNSSGCTSYSLLVA